MIPNHAFKPHSAGGRPVEHTGVGNLELAERHLISISGPDIGVRIWRWQTSPPPPEKALHCTGAEPLTDLVQSGGIAAPTESIIQSFVADTSFPHLPFGPLVEYTDHANP
jgi:hypothetical protein